MKQTLGLFILVSSLVLASVAVAERIPGIDELVSLNRPLAWAFSPNGKSIAYVVQSAK